MQMGALFIGSRLAFSATLILFLSRQLPALVFCLICTSPPFESFILDTLINMTV